MKREKILTVALVLVIIILVVGITYAWYTWVSNNMNYQGGSECFDVLYAKGDDIGSDQDNAILMPSDTYEGGLSSTVKINFSSSCTNINATGKLYLETFDTTSSNLLGREGLLNYQVLKNGEVTDLKGSIISRETIEIDIGTLSKSTSATDSYTIYVWVDNNLVENNDAFSSYYGKIRAEVSQIGV
ncbi:MAG: hypothetical protein IJZ46_02430 [Bacilli bacterium]|nr:hypothetical protein [Bacilli bacterium]